MGGFLFARKQDVSHNIILIADMFWRWHHVEPNSIEHISSGLSVIQKWNWPRYLQIAWYENNTGNAGVSIGISEINFCFHINENHENQVAVRVLMTFVTTCVNNSTALASIGQS